MEANSSWTLPKTAQGVNRTIYFYQGETLQLSEKDIPKYNAVELRPNADILLQNGSSEAGILVLQGQPPNCVL